MPMDANVMGRLVSVNVALPQDLLWRDRTVHTGLWKKPVLGARLVKRLNIEGDGQGDLAGHGGENRAVLVYQLDSYRFWQEELGRSNLEYGTFGENFTVDGLSDDNVCIGDRFRIGEAVFEVSQPRVTCYRAGIRIGEPGLAAKLVTSGRPGFYLRVLQEGKVQAGDAVTRVGTAEERMSVADIDALLYRPGHAREKVERALRIPALSPGWRHSFQSLLEQTRGGGAIAGNAGLTASIEPPLAWRGFRDLRVLSRVYETADVISLVLGSTDGQPLPTALPGQFIALQLKPDSKPAQIRSYSLSANPLLPTYRISIRRQRCGVGSNLIHEQLGVGQLVAASAPRGTFTLQSNDRPVVLLSAGIGVTPVNAMLQALSSGRSGREVWWLHGARSRREHAFAAEVRTALNDLKGSHSYVCFSAPEPDDRPDIDFNATGHIDMERVRNLDVPREADFYICGPTAFMESTSAGLTEWGVRRDRIHTEAFGSAPAIMPGIVSPDLRIPHPPSRSESKGFSISFSRSGLNVRWGAPYANLLELAEACDVPVRWACRSGVCHTCTTGLIAGSVAYRPEPVDAPADAQVLICCAQPQSDLVIDL